MQGETAPIRRVPGKRVVALGVLVLACIVSVIIFRGTEVDGSRQIAVVGTPRDTYIEIDSDGDGLKDWEEELGGTSPILRDTDSDGIDDGTEKRTAEEQDRKEQAEIAADITELFGPGTPGWESLSYEDQVSQTLLTEYLSLKQSDTPLTAGSIVSILQELPSYERVQPEVRTYTSTDIIVSGDSSTSALRTYGNALGTLLVIPEGESPQHELIALQSFMATGDSEALRVSLADSVARHDLVISGMQSISVPNTLTNEHIMLMNALSRVRSDLSVLQYAGEDPLFALSVVGSYNVDTSARAAAFTAIYNFLLEAGITYSEPEPGHLLSGA